jgi:hypothetical protein
MSQKHAVNGIAVASWHRTIHNDEAKWRCRRLKHALKDRGRRRESLSRHDADDHF